MQNEELLKKIQSIAFGHFSYLPRLLGFSVESNRNLTKVFCGLGSSMFNIAFFTNSLHTTLGRKEKENLIEQVVHFYQGQPFAWWFGPCFEEDAEFSIILLEKGFVIETTEHAMVLELSQYSRPPIDPNLTIRLADDEKSLLDFVNILRVYDNSAVPFFSRIKTDPANFPQQKLLVGYENDIPVSIGMLYLQGDTVGIFSLLTREDKRGKGYGTEMMVFLIQFAKELQAEFVTLSASSDSGFRIYQRLGFKSLGTFKCFEWKK